MYPPVDTVPPPVAGWQVFAWWLLTITMFLVWWAFFAGKKLHEFSLAERILGAFIGTVCQIVGTTLILGAAHYLSWWPLCMLNAVLIAGLAFFNGLMEARRLLISDIIDTLTFSWRLLRSSTVVFILGIIALLVIAWVVYLGQLMPPFCFDAWSYHLPWAAFARQEGHLGPFDQPMRWINIFPKNTDILFLWWILGTGTERWANGVQAPFGIASMLACYLLARRVGARRIDAAVAGLLVMSIPVVVHQMWMALVDVSGMCGSLASLAFLSRRRLTPGALVLAGCSAGFIVGTKGSGMFVFIGLLLFLLYRMLSLGMDSLHSSPGSRLRNMALSLALFAGLAFAFGSFFYLRNWVLHGNPTAEYELRVGPVLLFEGKDLQNAHFYRDLIGGRLYDALQSGSEWPIVLDGFYDPETEFYEHNRIGGWGSVWTTLMLPAIPVAVVWAFLRRRWAVLAIITACLIPYFLFTANHTWARYHLFIIGAGTTSFAYLLTMLRRTRWREVLLVAAALSMAATNYVAMTHRSQFKPYAISEARSRPYKESDRFTFFYGWRDEELKDTWLSIQEPGTTLGFTDGAPDWKMLALWNSDYSNRVVYVPWQADGETWEQFIIEKKVDYVYVWPDSEPNDYAVEHPGRFEPLYDGDNGGVYRIVTQDDSS